MEQSVIKTYRDLKVWQKSIEMVTKFTGLPIISRIENYLE